MADSAPAPTAVPRHFLTCLAGPDAGKRLAIGEARCTVGRAVTCNLLSDDADIAAEHIALVLRNGEPHFEAIAGSVIFLDGQPATAGPLLPGHQLRFGRSYWKLAEAEGAGGDDTLTVWVDRLSGQISAVAGVEKVRGFSPAEMFSEVLKRHTDDEIEEYFMVGSPKTTPPLSAVDDRWPKPWIFVRAMTLSLLAYAGFFIAYQNIQNSSLLLPGLVIVGSFAIPVSLLVFYFETNTPRNVSLYVVFKTFLLGSIVSLALSLLLFQVTKLDEQLGPPSAGIIEELGKAAALLLVIRKLRYRWILNGMLFGAAVGTGFAAFESAGYALMTSFNQVEGGGYRLDFDAVIHSINTRGMLTLLGGHIIWNALLGAALWRVRGDQPFRFDMLKDKRFWRVLALTMTMHALWNSKIPETLYIKYIVLGFVGWVATLAFIQAGLKQVQQERAKLAAAQLPGTTVSTPPAEALRPVVAAAQANAVQSSN